MPKRPPRDLELEVGATAHFADPAYYSQAYANRRDDIAFYTNLATRCGRVLEYGVGSGRIALPTAQAGADITGIDHSRPMLDAFKAQLRAQPPDTRKRVRLRWGDMRRVRLRKRFALVTCPFNTALHLYTRHDVEQWLARVRDHLEPRGELAVDLSMPMLEDISVEPGTTFSLPSFVHPRAGRVRYREVFDYDRVRQILFVSMRFEPKNEAIAPFMVPLAQRQFFPREWEALLHYNGFDVTDVYGDFHGGKLTSDSDVMVWRARKKRSLS
jgi:SAM-dependent methyltransferase